MPIRADLLASLRAYMPSDALATDTVFVTGTFPSLRAFKRDLVAAGLATVERRTHDENGQKYKQPREIFDTTDDEGRVIDFHALRVTFVSGLAAAGVHPRTAQALARHAKIETTMETYTDLRLLDLRAAVEQLDVPRLEDAGGHCVTHCASGSPPSASPCQEEGGDQEPPKGRKRGRKRQRDAEKSGGRYWTRTSDPQLVELVLYQLS